MGIVDFDSYASVAAKITEISTYEDRLNLLSAVPTEAGGGTDIADGLYTCHEVCVFLRYLRGLLWLVSRSCMKNIRISFSKMAVVSSSPLADTRYGLIRGMSALNILWCLIGINHTYVN